MTPPRVVAETREFPIAPASGPPPGRLILRVLVDVDGRVADLEVLRAPYGGEALQDAALAAVRGWRYEPARRDGSAVACWTVESIEFVSAPPTPPPAPAAVAAQPEPAASPPAGTVPPQEPPPEAAPASQAAPPPAVPPAPAAAAENLPEPRAAPPVIAAPALSRSAPAPAIDLLHGGPPPLELGGSGREAAAFLGGDPAAASIRAADRGLEVALVDRGGDRRVASIRYLFAEGREGFHASGLRTRSGLGKGSACLGIPAAQGRPTDRTVEAEANGVSVERLRYESDGVVATFVCVKGRLAEMTIAAAERPAGD